MDSPNCERLRKNSSNILAITEFCEWAELKYVMRTDSLSHFDRLAREFYGISDKELEHERRAMLREGS